jgi:hypothetical protein
MPRREGLNSGTSGVRTLSGEVQESISCREFEGVPQPTLFFTPKIGGRGVEPIICDACESAAACSRKRGKTFDFASRGWYIPQMRGVAQRLARMVWDHEAGGSNPLTPTMTPTGQICPEAACQTS